MLVEDNFCPNCGSKKLREVSDNDFCFFVNIDASTYEMLEFALKENNIESVGVPFYPNGVSYANAGRASGRKVFVRFKDFDQVYDIYETLFFPCDDET